MTVLDRILDAMKNGIVPSIHDLGGPAALSEASEELTQAPILDILALWYAATESDVDEEIDQVLLKGFRETPHPIPFRKACEIIIDTPSTLSRIKKPFVNALEKRFSYRSGGRDALIASYALEAIFRLALKADISRHKPLALMADISSKEDDIFASHAAKLVGSAYHIWQDTELRYTLEKISKVTGAEEEAVFEMGLLFLSLALQKDDCSEINGLLETARVYFDRASVLGENRADALAYKAVIDIVRAFSKGEVQRALTDNLKVLGKAVARWSTWLDIHDMPDWMRPSYDREMRWIQLMTAAHSIAGDLKKPSWLKAEDILKRVLYVYQADQTFTIGPGLGVLIQPQIEAAFIKERGLLSHLDDLLSDPDRLGCDRELAQYLRDRITESKKNELQHQVPAWADSCPSLAGILKKTNCSCELPQECALNIEMELTNYKFQDKLVGKPTVQRILEGLCRDLATCGHYVDEVKHYFNIVLQQVVIFTKSRLDGTKSQLRARGAYLFQKDASEWDLQADLNDFLVGNLTRADVNTEVTNVGSGRADICISFGPNRYVIELKKEGGDSSREGLKKYLDQTVAYQVSDVRLGCLGVLDLTPRVGPPPHIEESIWTEAHVPSGSELPRYVVVFRVAGCLQPPSSFSKK